MPRLAGNPLATTQGTGKRSVRAFCLRRCHCIWLNFSIPRVTGTTPKPTEWVTWGCCEILHNNKDEKIAISSRTAVTTGMLFSYIRKNNSFFTPTNILPQLISSGFRSWSWSGLSFPLAYINQFYDLKGNICIVLDLGKLLGSPFTSESTAN